MNRKLQGSLTIEASLIFPIVFFAIISLIYIGIYLHDVTCLKAIVNEAAQRYALAYSNKIDLDTGLVLTDDHRLDKGLYWRFTPKNDLSSKIKAYIVKEIEEKLIVKDDDIQVDTKIINYILKKNIEINVKKTFSTPIHPVNTLLKMNGKGGIMGVTSKVVVKDPTELIRNVELLDDLSDYIGPVRKTKEIYEKKIKDIIDFLYHL